MKPLIIIAVKCVLEKDNKILFIKEPKGNSWRPGTWSLPGGKIEANETYIDAIHREMHEETGLKVTVKGILKLIEIIRNVDSKPRLVHHYVVVVKKKAGKLKNPDHFAADFKWISRDELLKIQIEQLSEYYYKDVIKEYFENKKKLTTLSFTKIFDTNNDPKFKKWSRL